jgi:hypothetical protein
MALEIQVRRPCSRQHVEVEESGPSGMHHCTECGDYSYKRDGQMDHRLVQMWISLDELKELLTGKAADD